MLRGESHGSYIDIGGGFRAIYKTRFSTRGSASLCVNCSFSLCAMSARTWADGYNAVPMSSPPANFFSPLRRPILSVYAVHRSDYRPHDTRGVEFRHTCRRTQACEPPPCGVRTPCDTCIEPPRRINEGKLLRCLCSQRPEEKGKTTNCLRGAKTVQFSYFPSLSFTF